MFAAAQTLLPIDGLDYTSYAQSLKERFQNRSIAHETFQIAQDGSEKLPQRIFSAASDARAMGKDIRPFIFATAAWLRHISGVTHDCKEYELRDPNANELKNINLKVGPEKLMEGLGSIGILSSSISKDAEFWFDVFESLQKMLKLPMTKVIADEIS